MHDNNNIAFKLIYLSFGRNNRIVKTCVDDVSALVSAARGDLVVPRTRLQLGNRAFCGLVRSPGTAYHWTFVRHLHYQRSKTCSRHLFHVPTSLTNCFQSTSSEHCTTGALYYLYSTDESKSMKTNVKNANKSDAFVPSVRH